MYYARLRNYLGIPEITGSDFQKVAPRPGCRVPAVRFRTPRHGHRAGGERLHRDGRGWRAVQRRLPGDRRGAKGPSWRSAWVSRKTTGASVADGDGRTAWERLYVVGRATRPTRSQAIIAAGHAPPPRSISWPPRPARTCSTTIRFD